MARKKKNTEEVGTPVQAESQPQPVVNEADSIIALKQRLAQMEEAFMQKAIEAEALRTAGAAAHGGQRVVVQNTGYVQLAIPCGPEGTIILDGNGPSSTNSIPLHIFAALKRSTDWFEKGYIKVVGEVNENPNIIEDPAAWIATLHEHVVDQEVQKITSEGPLNKLWAYLEDLKTPTGKELVVKKAIQKRYEALMGADLVEDLPGE
jgi:hypothetical protein